jgi:dihydrofolate reductase
MANRKVIASVMVSLDGFTAGPGGDQDVMWFVEHAVPEQMTTYFEGVYRGSTTALMGRKNYEGYYAVWPPVANDPDASPRDRDLATWMETVEKVVFSQTLKDAEWQNARIAENDTASEVRALKAAEGRDIIILNSASIIQALLKADLVDDLRLNLVPALVGGGLRLFGDALPRSDWDLAGVTTLATGALGLHYTRQRS